jgi:glycosyltransferase involved in cell wall biosynthesis
MWQRFQHRAMKILLVCHYFPPEIGAPQSRLGDLSRMWAQDGDEVTVLTCMPNHPTGVVPPEYRGKWRLRERLGGADVVRTWSYATPNEGFVKKILGHLSFMVTGPLFGWRQVGRPDVVVVSSPTFFSIFSAWLFARFKRAPLVVEVRDLWPAIFVELGVLRNPLLIKALERLELAAYRAAALVVVVTEGFRTDLVRRGIPADKVVTIRNGVDVDRFAVEPAGARAEWRNRLGFGNDETLVLYVGAHGVSHGLDTVLEASTKARPGIRFVFVGEGAEKRELVTRAESLRLGNVSFHDGIPSAEIPGLLRAADICLVPLRGDVPLFSTFIPSKLFEFLAAERAVVAAVRGEAAEILEDAGALVVEPGDPDALAGAVNELADDPDRRSRMGAIGQAHVRATFDRRQLADEYRSHLATTAG